MAQFCLFLLLLTGLASPYLVLAAHFRKLWKQSRVVNMGPHTNRRPHGVGLICLIELYHI